MARNSSSKPTHRPSRDNEGSDFNEEPNAHDLERFGGATRVCPACKKEVYDDAEICHECGHAFLVRSEHPAWVAPVMIAIVVAFLLAYFGWLIF